MDHGDETPSGLRWSQVNAALIERIERLSTDDVLDLLESGSADEKWQATLEVGYRREVRAFEPLLSLLKDADYDVQRGAGLALSDLGDPTAVPALLAAIRERHRKESGASALVFAVYLLDPLGAAHDLAEFVQDGNYVESIHGRDGLRNIWDELDPADRQAITADLERRILDPEIEEWRADLLDEILTDGAWTPGERAVFEGREEPDP